jgi:ATP-dependent DNA helicase RecQ
MTVSGFGPAKVEAYGAAITAICRNPDGDRLPLTAPVRPVAQAKAFVASSYEGRGALLLDEPEIKREPVTFHRERSTTGAPVADPARELDARQQELDLKLREWRKAEAEKMGLPQFFVLGTSTLRSIVLARPRTVGQLKSIGGIDEEKVSRFGGAILEMCNG